MVVEAVSKLDHATLDLKLIGTKKVQGGGLRDSFLVDGVAFKKTFSYAGFEMQPKQYKDPSILLLNIELELKSEKENAEVGFHYTLFSRLACAQATWQGSATHRLGAQDLLRGMSTLAAECVQRVLQSWCLSGRLCRRKLLALKLSAMISLVRLPTPKAKVLLLSAPGAAADLPHLSTAPHIRATSPICSCWRLPCHSCRSACQTPPSTSLLWTLSGTSSTASWRRLCSPAPRWCCRGWPSATWPLSTLQTGTSSAQAGSVLEASATSARQFLKLC